MFLESAHFLKGTKLSTRPITRQPANRFLTSLALIWATDFLISLLLSVYAPTTLFDLEFRFNCYHLFGRLRSLEVWTLFGHLFSHLKTIANLKGIQFGRFCENHFQLSSLSLSLSLSDQHILPRPFGASQFLTQITSNLIIIVLPFDHSLISSLSSSLSFSLTLVISLPVH